LFYKKILHSVIVNADQDSFLTYKKFGVLKTATATKSTMNDPLIEEVASFNRDSIWSLAKFIKIQKFIWEPIL